MMIDIGKELQDAFDDGYRKRDAEIVRCKDCKYYESKCDYPFCYYTENNVELDDYCSFGEKREMDEISNIARESADKISKALEKVRAKGMQKQNIKEDDEP